MRSLRSERLFVQIALIIGFLFALSYWGASASPLTLSEPQFADTSPSGLSIVPASCPSNPHYEYKLVEPCPYNWGDAGTPGYLKSCYAYVLQDCTGQCTAETFCDGSIVKRRDTQCAVTTLEVCPHGCSNGRCIVPPDDCDGPSVDCGGQCATQLFCVGNDLYIRSMVNSQCTTRLSQQCAFGCYQGSCNVSPPGSLNLRVSPAVVRSGRTTQVSWTSADVESCVVTEDNADINDRWTGLSGTYQSSPIDQKTVYTLSCTDEEGRTYTDIATVNVIPVFEEQ